VPELILQPLVENALRHGIGKRTDSGELIISARRDGGNLALTVQDDGPGLPTTGVQDGVGLANTRERLSTLYSDRAHLELSSGDRVGTVALIRLPFREITSKPGNSGVSGND
jgi:LytS/YehU family sensor histidine kinase